MTPEYVIELPFGCTSCMASTDRQRWARVPPALAWKRPGLPTEWTRVLDRNPEAMNPVPLPSCVWLETPGKVLHVDEHLLEFMWDTPESRASA